MSNRKVLVRGKFRGKVKDSSIGRSKKDQNQDKRLEKVEKKISKINNMVELKYIDSSITGTFGTSGVSSLMNGTLQDGSAKTRIGSDIFMTSVQLHYNLRNIAATAGATQCRLMCVLDHQANGAAPLISGDPTTAGQFPILDTSATGTLMDAPYCKETQKRYRILYDKKMVFNPITALVPATPTYVPVQMRVDKYIKLGVRTKYADDNVITIAAIATNSLYIIGITDVANGITALGGARVYFRDP